ncbi:MAG: hypothetical protein K1Y01_04870 [Vicinamibacteria bacterium]|nr:hypothetical protein [Vicinamibacteria bacterium]
MNRSSVVAALAFLLGGLVLSLPVGREIHVPLGGARGPVMMSGLGPSVAVWGLGDREALDSRRDFYFRPVESMQPRISIPLRPRGPFSLGLRMDTTVRTRVEVVRGEEPLGSSYVISGPWRETPIVENVGPTPLELTLHLADAPLVRRSDTGNFRRYLDEIVLRGDSGFDLPWESRLAGGLAALLLVGLVQISLSSTLAVVAALGGPLLLAWVLQVEPVGLALGLPRLLGFALATTGLIFLSGRALAIGRRASAALALLGVAMVLVFGFLSFLPNHSPADLDIHIWRTVDLGSVPSTYDAWLRYGSHYPTPSQIRGSATETLGEGPAIPYSPVPYLLFYAAHATGLDLHWSMNAIEAVSLALLLPLVFAFARSASNEAGGFLAAVLMALDLATIHRLGRAHSPAVVGGALGVAGLLVFGLALPRMSEPGRWRLPALLLGLGALGYSSTPLYYGLFGVAMMLFALAGTDTRRLFPSIALSLGLGGALALVVFYGHYVPGLLAGRSGTLMTDTFPGRTFFIFHNESRQSLRLWRLGLWVSYLAALPAIGLVLTRTTAAVRSFLLAWVTAWAGIMLLKEPWGLPVLLRWAKEDFYVAPSLALLIAIAIARIESRPVRMALSTAALLAWAFLRARDYGFHADTLRFLM